LVSYDRVDNHLTVYSPYHGPVGREFRMFEDGIRLPRNSVRLIVPDVGGSFGTKIMCYPYVLIISAISMKLCRPVMWIVDRSDELKMSAHSPERVAYAEVAAKRDGKILGLKAKIIDNFGAYMLPPEPNNIVRPFSTFTGPYGIRDVYIDAYGVLTNKCVTGPNRGYGCQHTFFMLERMMDLAARKLQIDPAEIRSRNLIKKDEFPYTTPLGCVYDSGDYAELLKRALGAAGYESLRSEQERLRKQHRYLGIGITTTMEPSGSNSAQYMLSGMSALTSGTAEAVSVKVHQTGEVSVSLGTAPQGQGHETSAAQVVASELGVDMERVFVERGFDSVSHPFSGSSGTYASRFAVTCVPALVTACQTILDKATRIAARMLKVNFDDLVYRDGKIHVAGLPETGYTLSQIANQAYFGPGALPPSLDISLEATCVYNFPFPGAVTPDGKGRLNGSGCYAGSAHVAVVEVDAESGLFKILRYVAVHDAGTVINPTILAGQIHGGILHGIGGAVYEEFEYDETGQLLSSTFADYLLPTAVEAPMIESEHLETPSPLIPIGSKGTGEGGAMASPVTLANAIDDALVPFGVKITDLPLKPESIWRIIRAKEGFGSNF
ncbi:MAG: xanthine dehydrogenase family protein molybdopterin-binding subunit, partial [Rhabdochlamydiaceae bacterium]